ncbi:unnamed protein product [Closterium sp. Naga37s-1]|nr:unnamed protein product [Closterium sp. Naga37s-1]
MTRATRQKEKEEEQAGRRATRRLSQQTDREGGGGSKGTNASAARGRWLKILAGKKAAFGQEKSGKKAEEKEKTATTAIGSPTVVEISAAVVDKAKAGEHSIVDVGGSPPSGGCGRRRQRKSDGEEGYNTAMPGDINTRSKRRQTSRGADNAGGAEVGTTRGTREESGKATGHALRKKGRPAARRTSGGRRGKKDEGDAGDEEEEADEEEDAEEEKDEEDAEEEDADVGEE